MATTAKAWLNGKREYGTGLEILKANGVSEFILDLLADGPDSYNTPKLLQEIEIIAAAEFDEQAAAPAPSVTEAPAAPGEPDAYRPDDSLEKKLRYDAQIVQLWKEICHLHGKLSSLPEGPELYQVAYDIRIKDLKRQDLWDHLRYFKEHGKWFDEQPENLPKPEDIPQAIKNLMANRSKVAAHLKKPLPIDRREFYQAKWDQLTRQIEALKKSLKSA